LPHGVRSDVRPDLDGYFLSAAFAFVAAENGPHLLRARAPAALSCARVCNPSLWGDVEKKHLATRFMARGRLLRPSVSLWPVRSSDRSVLARSLAAASGGAENCDRLSPSPVHVGLGCAPALVRRGTRHVVFVAARENELYQ